MGNLPFKQVFSQIAAAGRRRNRYEMVKSVASARLILSRRADGFELRMLKNLL
jgi:hypothetical protein